ncbi:efflux RND transporter permease subunit [Atopomonas sediminilitoris]|uniref:efflux RND transporter permease subunit n=1 Tax=Atopomonas sediminilitoris TaxID=2919919 RepID=UPI001F4DCC67|nr:efflux RND transporter permease subunit [Atopomonas sediminilitoris]MCJ8167879.1 efflux RND transporter permease subunit [Atopomonas sediminilitoris]
MNAPAQRGILAWWASNPVAANLLMIFILLLGVFSYQILKKRTFPDFEVYTLQVTVPFRGGAPEDVEKGVVIKIEEAVQDLKGIKRINSTATDVLGTVLIELHTGTDIDSALNDVKNRIDAITSFPDEAEKPIVAKFEPRQQVLWLSLHGNLDEILRKRLAQQIRDDILALPAVNQAEVVGDREFEISVEVSEVSLRRYGLTFDDVAKAIRQSSIDLSGGHLKTAGGDIQLRSKTQAYQGDEFRRLVLRTFADGSRLYLGDIAQIKDGFEESQGFSRFNGTPSLSIQVVSLGDQNDLLIAQAVKDYVTERRASLPPGVELDSWGDASYYLNDRLDMMFRNMFQGALLVFLVLSLFLRLRVAFWVILGIPVAFAGALWLMNNPLFPIGINMLSLFGFILVLGIVVDDAIIIGESIYSEVREHGHSLDNVISGANRVATAATFGVLTTVVAFVPMLFIEGTAGAFFESLALVVILCLLFSLVESKWILPAHLAHRPLSATPPTSQPSAWARLQAWCSGGLERIAREHYPKLLAQALHYRAVTVALFITLLLAGASLMVGGWVKIEIFPDVPSDFIRTNLTMNNGTSASKRNEALDHMEAALHRVEADYHAAFPDAERGFIQYVLVFTDSDLGGQLVVELEKPEARQWDAKTIENKWREAVGQLPGARQLRFYSGTHIGGGSALDFQLSGSHYPQLKSASEELAQALAQFDGVFDIRSSFSAGAQEIRLKIKPAAEALGLTQAELARQVRQAFFGEEAQRIQRGRDDVRVMVRYPEAERRSRANLENMRIRTANGDEVPFSAVASIEQGEALASISRSQRKRVVSITADIDQTRAQSTAVINEVDERIIPAILAKYPGVSYNLTGSAEEQQKFVSDFVKKFSIAIIGIYILLAVPLKSYSQPLLIMAAIPYGFVGAVFGHWLSGQAFSMLSCFGLIALSGVVVNDSLVMVDFVNRAREEGLTRLEAILQAGSQRFRAIILTSLTTFFGLLPILFETSLQAQFLKPMATALGFGILFATAITLFLVPCLYLLLSDAKALLRRLWHPEQGPVQ